MKVQIYELIKCGFYESYTDDKELEPPIFGSLPEWWGEFSGWVEGADYKETSTFYRQREPERVYCIGRTTDAAGNYGVALWNVAPSVNGRAMHLPPFGEVDDVQAKVAEVTEGSTAGWPSYFWLMPNESIIVGLIPSSLQGTGIPHARDYFYKYLKERSGYYKGGGYNRVGLSMPEAFVPRFLTRALRRPGDVEEISEKWREIRKYVSNTSFEPPTMSTRSHERESIASWLPMKVRNSHQENHSRNRVRTYRFEADWRPESKEAVEEVFSYWEDQGYDDNNWAGVKTKDGRLYRFDEMICKEPINVELEIDSDPRWSVETLESVWQKAKPSVTALLDQVRRSRNSDRDTASAEQPDTQE